MRWTNNLHVDVDSIWNCRSFFTGLTWLNRLRIRVPSLRTRHVSSWGIHGSHWIGGTPTEYLSTASVRVDLSSSYVSNHRTYVRNRKLISLKWSHKIQQQPMNLSNTHKPAHRNRIKQSVVLGMVVTSLCTNTHCRSGVKLRSWERRLVCWYSFNYDWHESVVCSANFWALSI